MQTVQLLCRSKHEVDLTVNVVFNEIDAINIVTKRGIIFSESQDLDFHRFLSLSVLCLEFGEELCVLLC